MAILGFYDRVKETTTTTGLGAFTMGGAATGFQAFSTAGDGNSFYYAVWDGLANWEVGQGTYHTSGNTVSRDTVLFSSNANALVNFGTGSKTIWIDAPASVFISPTAGSVIFGSSANRMTQDNAKFFFDDTGKQLMVGTNNPTILPLGTAVAGGNLVAYRTQSVDGFSQGLLRLYTLFDGTGQNLGSGTFAPAGNVIDFRSTDLANPMAQILTGSVNNIIVGHQSSPNVAAVGTVVSNNNSVYIDNCATYESEHAAQALTVRYNTNNNAFGCTTPGRGWLTDYNIHGPIESQQGGLSGITTFINNYYNGVPGDDPTGAYWAVTGPGNGGGVEFYHKNGRNYQVCVGVGVVGFSGNARVNRGYEVGLQIGGNGSAWSLGASHIGTGIDCSNFDTSGTHYNKPFSGVLGMYLVAGGSGYTTLPTVVFTGGLGANGATATATCEFTATTLASVTVGNGGSNYTSVPTATVDNPWPSGTAATVTAVMGLGQLVLNSGGSGFTNGTGFALGISPANGATGTFDVVSNAVTNLVITAAGTGATSQPAITFPGAGAGTGAAATAYLKLVSVTVNTAGSGYTLLPAISFSGGGGGGATASSVMTATSLNYIRVSNPGYGYTSSPAITFTGGAGSGAVAIATTVNSGCVGDCYILNPGSGYSQKTQPSFTVSGGQGTGATLSITAASGPITAATVNAGGTGYPVSSTVYLTVISGGGSGGVVSVATSAAGAITGTVTILAAGTGYATSTATTGSYLNATFNATVSVNGSINGLMVTDHGGGYSTPPTVTIGAPGPVTATGTPVITGDSVSSVTMTNNGYGYLTSPSVTFNNGGTGGTGAIGTATLRFGRVDHINILSGGHGYTSAPTVTLGAPPAGSTATTNTVSLVGSNCGILVNSDTTATGFGQPKAFDNQTNNVSNWCVDNAGKVGFQTSAPTHPSTFSSTANVSNVSQVFYNTTDQVTNFERLEMGWGLVASNVFGIRAQLGGSGTARSATWYLATTSNNGITINSAINGGVVVNDAATSVPATTGRLHVGSAVNANTSTSGTSACIVGQENYAPTATSTMVGITLQSGTVINYSNATPGAGSVEGLRVGFTELALPTGQSYLIHTRAGLTALNDLFVVQNNGNVGVFTNLPTVGYHQIGNQMHLAALATPSAPTTAVGGGTPAGATDFYFVVAQDANGFQTLVSAASASAARGSSAANWRKVTWTGVPGAVKYFVLVNTTSTAANTTLMALTGTWSTGVITGISSLVGGSGGTAGTFTDGTLTGGGGSGATFAYTISGGAVTNICILNSGSKYNAQPTFTLPSAGSLVGFSATANIAAVTTAGGTNLEADDSGQAINGAFTLPARNNTADATVDGNVIFGPATSTAMGTMGQTTSSVSSTLTAETKSLVGTISGTFTPPANFMTIGRGLRLKGHGVITTGATAGTITFQVKYAATVIASTGAIAPTVSQSNMYWEMECDIICRTTGSSGTFFVQGKVFMMNAATPSAGVTWPIRGNSADPPAVVTVDTTASSLVDYQSITSNALHTITANQVMLEDLAR